VRHFALKLTHLSKRLSQISTGQSNNTPPSSRKPLRISNVETLKLLNVMFIIILLIAMSVVSYYIAIVVCILFVAFILAKGYLKVKSLYSVSS
jgi:uncharacterized membrane protein